MTSTANIVPAQLNNIRSTVTRSGSLRLDHTILGQDHIERFARIFRSSNRVWELTSCDNVQSYTNALTNALTFDATIDRLYPWTKVRASICLTDEGQEAGASSRQWVLRIQPETPSIAALDYLGLHATNRDIDATEPGSGGMTPVLDYANDVAFGASPVIMYYSTRDVEAAELPEGWRSAWGSANLPPASLRRGLNFRAEAKTNPSDTEFHRLFAPDWAASLIGGTPPDRRLNPGWCLIYPDRTDPDQPSDITDQDPPGLVFVLTRSIEEVEFRIGPLTFTLSAIDTHILLDRPWGGRVAPRTHVRGRVAISSALKPLSMSAEYNDGTSVLSLWFTQFPKLADLLASAGIDAGECPPPLKQLAESPVQLSRLGIELDPKTATIYRISFTIDTRQEPCDLIPGVIKVVPSLSIGISFPFDSKSRSFEGLLSGDWKFDRDIELKTLLAYPSLYFRAELINNKSSSSEGFLAKFMPNVNLPVLSLKEIEVQGNIRQRTVEARIAADIRSDRMDNKSWGFDLSYAAEFNLGFVYADQRMNSCEVVFALDLGESRHVDLTAAYNAGRDGLQFRGSLTGPISIDAMIKGVGKLFGQELHLPEMLSDFTVDFLEVSFNTHSKNFSFDFDGSLKIGSSAMRAAIRLDCTHSNPDGTSISFRGQLTVSTGHQDLEFALNFDKDQTSSRAIGSYYGSNSTQEPIQSFVKLISPELALAFPPSLTFGLQDVLLGYSGSKTGRKWLLGIDIEGGLDLSDIRLPNLPLLSRFAVPTDQSLKLAVQIIGASSLFTADEIDALASIDPHGLKLPRKEVREGLALSGTLRLGRESKLVNLPVGMKKDGGHGTSILVSEEEADYQASSVQSDAQVSDNGVQWIAIQKSFGPLHFERVGIGVSLRNDNRVIQASLDASLSVGGLTIALDGLSVSSPIQKFAPAFDLRGLGIDYRNGALEIGGAFLKRDTKDEDGHLTTAFAGMAVVRAETLTLSAAGAYQTLADGHASMFVYAVLDYPLGGPAFFFVTGLAAGFGYNRSLAMPAIDQVRSFPLVARALSPGTPKPLEQDRQSQLTETLESMLDWIRPEVGEHFLAAGVTFTTFKRLSSLALLIAKFGKELEFDLLGVSSLTMPGGIAEAELVLKATFNPGIGILRVRSELTPNSFLFSPSLHLSGGFAFYSWFKDQTSGHAKISAGDFVLTLGGYHPKYSRKEHYPLVPRLGFNGQLGGGVQLKGDAYFAMTPDALMAGGHLEIVWQKERLRAWLKAGTDFLFSWLPCHYQAEIGIDVGASYTFDLFGSHTVTGEFGAHLLLAGPPFHGTARIDWWIISFTVSFGGEARPDEPVEWKKFKDAFLPGDDKICGVVVSRGLVKQIREGTRERWIVNPKDLTFVTNSVIPSLGGTGRAGSGHNVDLPRLNGQVGIRPMGVGEKQWTSEQEIIITRKNDDAGGENGDMNWAHFRFRFTPVPKAVPVALWGTPLSGGEPAPNDTLIDQTLAGYEICSIEDIDEDVPVKWDSTPQLEAAVTGFDLRDWTIGEQEFQATNAIGGIVPDIQRDILLALRATGVMR